MKKQYREHLDAILPFPAADRDRLIGYFSYRKAPAGTILLSGGEVATKLFFVIRGCLRTYFIKENGSEITSQFFLENQMVASYESAMTSTPSRSYIEAIEDSDIAFITMKHLGSIIRDCEPIRTYFNMFISKRLIYYMKQHASFILDNPEKRYTNLLKESPDIVSRVPQQYIASYLGITPVSLSRIKSRIKKSN
jgi:CRP-like cAMP-binding protein